MLQRVKEVQESDLRMSGSLARNIQRVIAVTQADIDAAAAQGRAWVVKPVVKVSDPIDNLRGGTQLVIKQNSILPGQNVMRVLYSDSEKTVGPAVAPLSLPGAAADDIMSLIAFGGTEQSGVPVDYKALNGVTNGANTAVATGIQPTVDDVEWELRVKPTTDSWYILQARSGGQSIWGISGSTTGSTILLGWNGNQSLLQSSITRNATHTYYVKATAKNGVATLYVKDETAGTEDTQTTTYTFSTAQLPSSQFYLFANGNPQYVGAGNTIYMARIKVGGVTVMDYVPALNPSNVVGFYDNATGVFKVSSAGTLTADQTIVPTPNAPIDIVCNNGVLTFTPNLLDMASENIVLGKYINNSGVVADSGPNFYNSKYIPVSAGQTYTWSTSSSIGYFSVMEYDSSYTFKKRTLFSNVGTSGSITLRNDTAFVLIGSNMDGTDVTLDKVSAVDWQFELGSSATSYKPYSENKVYTAGPIETIAIKDDQNTTVSTATCKDLFALGTDYVDQQEVISGTVTRKLGVYVFDGSETFQNGSNGWITETAITNQANIAYFPFCTHFGGTDTTPVSDSNTVRVYRTSGNAGRVYFGVNKSITEFSTAAKFQQWFANQYAAGTPVIIVYVLETPTTNTATPQPMQTAAGDNTAEITQAGMAGLELEVEYVEA